jgi:effector-binding domain-containing protein
MSTEPEIVTRPAVTLAARRASMPLAGIRDFFDSVYSTVARVATAQDAGIAGPALAVYYRFDPAADVVDVAAGFPTARPVTEQDGVVALELPVTRVARFEHVGSYDALGDAHGRVVGWITDQGHAPDVPFVETYLTEPSPEADPATMRTLIEYPVTG